MTSPFPRVKYNSSTRSFLSPSFAPSTSTMSSVIPRRPKRKSKSSLAVEKYTHSKKGKDGPTFQKKLVVFNCMGHDPPSHFTRKDKNIIMRGLLPEISVDLGEEAIRKEICDVIRNCKEHDMSLCSDTDFEFIDMNGKQASVPNYKHGYQFTGRAIKNLAGTGCVYVRLTMDFIVLSSDGSDSDLPKVNVTNRYTTSTQSEEDQGVGLDTPPSYCSDPSPPHYFSRLTSSPGPSREANPSSDPSHSKSTIFTPESSSHSTDNDILSNLVEMFPHVCGENVKFVYAESGSSATVTTDCLMDGPTLSSIRSVLRASRITMALADSPKIRLDADDDGEDWVSAAVTYYKSLQFEKHSEVRISLRGQPAVDTGGVRRQFFALVLGRVASEKYRLFEGPSDHLRPVFRMSNVSSGLLRVVGVMVAHSLLLDGQSFPYLSECCYYYLAGSIAKAISLVSENDLGEQVKSLVLEVILCS